MCLFRIRSCANFGLLIVRLGLGAAFIAHGWPKISGGPHLWGQLGFAMGSLGIHFAPVFWGFMAAAAEFFGGIALLLGAFFRPACLLLVIDMAVALTMHLHAGAPFSTVWSHALEDMIMFAGLFFIGPGAYSIDLCCMGKSCCGKTTTDTITTAA
jgi:putative oxidoreductase